MTLASTLRTALSGLSTAQRALGVTANNVANANTAGYVRKVHSQETVVIDGRAAGVAAGEAQRIADRFLQGELRTQRSVAARSTALAEVHGRIQEGLFGRPGEADRGVAARIEQLSGALEAFANAPDKAPLRIAVVQAASELTRQLGADAATLQDLRRDADQRIAATVSEINQEIQTLHELNLQFARGLPTPELSDQRDAALQRLAERIEISTFPHDDGTIAVYTRGGQPLLEYGPRRLDYGAPAAVAADTVFGPITVYDDDQIDPATGRPRAGETGTVLISGGVRAELTPELQADATPDAQQVVASPLTAGRLQGLLEARDRVLPELADQLGELAEVVRFALNAAHNAAVPTPPPNRLAGTRTDLAGWTAASNGGTAYLAVVDRATGAPVTTVAVDVTAASPAALVSQLNADLAGLGTAAIGADGALTLTATDPDHGLALDEGDSRIPVADAAGHGWSYGFAHYFGLNDLVVPSGSGSGGLAVRADIAADVSRLGHARLDVDTGPPLTSILGGRGDNRGAQALAGALDTTVTTVARGKLPGASVTVAGYAADLVAGASVDAAAAESAESGQRAVLDDLEARNGAVSGVNLDEELSRLVLYQQSYVVSARVISITNELFDELLSMAR